MPRYSKIATTVFLALAFAFDAYHSVIARTPWAGYQLGMNYASLFLLPLLAATIVAIYSERPMLTPMVVFGLFGLLTHGVFVAEGGDKLAGFAFVGLSVLASVSVGGLLFGKLLSSYAPIGRNPYVPAAPVKAA